MDSPKKSLGQHWLQDEPTLDYIVSQADLKIEDTVLEVGPGTGNLTAKLLSTGAKVVAVEKDETLAQKLLANPNLTTHSTDILKFDLNDLPKDYKVVANIPYYLTNKLLRNLTETNNQPSRMVLLVQKEVAERICAEAGKRSLLSISCQLDYQCQLGDVVPADLFEPPPKVDSQVVVLDRLAKVRFDNLDREQFFKVVKAGFSERRKKLRSSLAGGLGLTKPQSDELLEKSGIDGNRRAQELTLEDWQKISNSLL